MKFTKSIIFTLILLFLVTNCGLYDPTVDARKIPNPGPDRARKNVDEGRGLSIKGLGNKGTNFEFSTSNPMWRASLEILDFLPLSTVDYGGGIIISDWYNDGSNKDESIKITVRFLSNEIQSYSLKVIVHQKKCVNNSNCVINKIDSKIKEELIKSILTQAAILEKQDKKKKKS